MSDSHVRDLLAAYLDGELGEAERRRVEAHLAGCEPCRKALSRVRQGGELAGEMAIMALPPDAEERILAALRGAQAESAAEGAGRPSGRRRWWWGAAAAAAAFVLLFVLRSGPDVSVQPAAGEPTVLEEVALAAHAGLVDGDRPLDLPTASPAEVRGWLAERGLSAALALDRPPAERARFMLLGAADLSRPGLRAAAVSYRVDGHPVLLVAGRAEEVPGAPRWGPFGKRVLYRRDNSVKLLSWTNSGEAYTLISDLPGLGQTACLLCHTDPERRRLVERLGAGV